MKRFNSITNFIAKSKNIFENKLSNQTDLFGENKNQDLEIISNIGDWKFEVAGGALRLEVRCH